MSCTAGRRKVRSKVRGLQGSSAGGAGEASYQATRWILQGPIREPNIPVAGGYYGDLLLDRARPRHFGHARFIDQHPLCKFLVSPTLKASSSEYAS